MGLSLKIVCITKNELTKSIVELEVKKQNMDFYVFTEISDVFQNKGTLLIIDLSNLNKTDSINLIDSVKKEKNYTYTCLLFGMENNDLISDYQINNDFSNLEDTLLNVKALVESGTVNKENQTFKAASGLVNSIGNLKGMLSELLGKIDKLQQNTNPYLHSKKVVPQLRSPELVVNLPKLELTNSGISTNSPINFSKQRSELDNTHILLADDSKPVRKFVTKILEEKNFDVTTFVNGQELIDYLNEGKAGDIILLDNQMPVKDGMTTLQEIKGNERWRNIPILFLSAITAKEQVVEALVLGADDYMEKPFNNNEFLARINVHVRIDQLKKAIVKEKEKSDKLILNTLPKKIVDDLKMFGKTEPETFENVTVYFSDIVSFTNHSTGMAPADLINELNILFTKYDTIMENHGCERIKTIGDAYLAVSGMPVANEKHAYNMAMASVEIARFMQDRFDSREDGWELRIGLHTGSVVGGIVGEKKYLYDVFGDTINTSSRMESNSIPMHINVSETTYELLKDDFPFIKRDPLNVKGKGTMVMYFLDWPNVKI